MQVSEFYARFQEACGYLWLGQPFHGTEMVPHTVLTNSELFKRLEKDLEPVGLPWVQLNGSFDSLVGFVLEDCLDA